MKKDFLNQRMSEVIPVCFPRFYACGYFLPQAMNLLFRMERTVLYFNLP